MIANRQEALLCGMPVRQNDKKTLEGQGRQQACRKNGQKTRTGSVRGPTRIQLARSDSATEGQVNPPTIQIRHNIC